MSGILDRMIAGISPAMALRRAQSRKALDALMNYEAVRAARKGRGWRPVATDADGASAQRGALAFIARDMIRNTPFAARAQMIIAGNVVGDGIIPKVIGADEARALELIERHLDTTAIDADGLNNLYGLQRLAVGAMVDSGEVLIRRRRRRLSDGLPLPLQLQVMEADYIDSSRDTLAPGSPGVQVVDGIEYDAIGRRVAYWLYDDHPGRVRGRIRTSSRRVPASEIVHLFRVDRPGQNRGVTWFAPVATTIQDLADYQDAQIVRQKIAACFAAFRTSVDGEPPVDLAETISPGAIEYLGPGEDVRFAQPPAVDGFGEFQRFVLRSAAAGLGITYESLSGDLSDVNFSSARMGRLDMDRNVSAWQWQTVIPRMLNPVAEWFLEAWAVQDADPSVRDARVTWTPPRRPLVDPTKELPAMGEAVRLGFDSRSNVIRTLGFDPERVLEQQIADRDAAEAAGLTFSSNAAHNQRGTVRNEPE